MPQVFKIEFFRIVVISICFSIFYIHSRANKPDSLTAIIKNEKVADTSRIKSCRELAYYYMFENVNTGFALKSAEEGIRIAAISGKYLWQARLTSLKAYILQYFTNDQENAIENYFQSLRLYDRAGSTDEKISSYLNLGNIYYQYNQPDDAEKYFKYAEVIALRTQNEEDIALVYNNLGSTYNLKKKDDLALQYYTKARYYYKKFNREFDIAVIDFNMMNISVNRIGVEVSAGARNEAIEVYTRVKDIFKQYEQTGHYIRAIHALGVQLTETGKLKEGMGYYVEAEKIATELRDFLVLKEIYNSMAENSRKRKSFEEEAEYLKKKFVANDSLFNVNKSKVIAETQIKYQTERTATENELLQQKSKIQALELTKKDIEISQSNIIRYTLIGGISLVLLFTIFLFNRFKITNRQKKIIEQQKLLVEEKNKEVLDSIIYAKRLQDAILPSQKIIKKILPENFILYKPKDIVAGDFYWMESTGDYLFIAAADCTGHGVPGAMVSVICSNALNRAVKEMNFTDPGKILDKVREMVIEQFAKSDEEVKDGMDISLLCIHTKTNEMKWAGANNPLWIVQKSQGDMEQATSNKSSNSEFASSLIPHGFCLKEIKPNKQPIGFTDKPAPFETHTVTVEKGDIMYLFTDGYADQFGGENGKKFKTSNLKKLFLSVKNEAMEKQKELIHDAFRKWKGNLEQVDDVCVIGIRI